MSKYTAKQIAESDDLFDKQIHKVRKFYLSRNPDKMMMLEERKAVIKERNKGNCPFHINSKLKKNMNKNIINNAQLLEIKTKIRQLGAMMNTYQCRFVVSSGQLFFVDDEYAGTVKLTNLDNGESNISFPSCDDGLIINPADKHIK